MANILRVFAKTGVMHEMCAEMQLLTSKSLFWARFGAFPGCFLQRDFMEKYDNMQKWRVS